MQKLDLYRKMGLWNVSISSKNEKTPDDRNFYPSGHTVELLGYKILSKKGPQGTEKKINFVSIFFNFHENDYSSAKSREHQVLGQVKLQ